MTALSSKIGTILLVGKIKTFTRDNGVKSIALKLVSGTVTYAGTIAIISNDGDEIQSTAQTLGSAGFQFSCSNPVDGFTVDATLGEVTISFIQG